MRQAAATALHINQVEFQVGIVIEYKFIRVSVHICGQPHVARTISRVSLLIDCCY